MDKNDKYWFKWTSPGPFAAVYPVNFKGWIALVVWLASMLPLMNSILHLLKQQDLIPNFTFMSRYIPLPLITSVLFVYFILTKSNIKEGKRNDGNI